MPKKRNFNAARDGTVHVCAKMCKTCIYRPGSPAFNTPIKREAVRDGTAVICHDTLDGDNAVCRGFFENENTPPLAFAKYFKLLTFV